MQGFTLSPYIVKYYSLSSWNRGRGGCVHYGQSNAKSCLNRLGVNSLLDKTVVCCAKYDRLPLRFNFQVLPKRLWDWLSVRCAIRDLYRQVLITVWLRTKFCWGLCRGVAEDFIYCPSKAKVYEAVCCGVAWEFNIGLQKWSLMRLFVAAGWCGCHSKEALEEPYELFLTY